MRRASVGVFVRGCPCRFHRCFVDGVSIVVLHVGTTPNTVSERIMSEWSRIMRTVAVVASGHVSKHIQEVALALLCVCVGHPGCGCSWLGDVAACAVSAEAGGVCIVLQHPSHSSDQDNCPPHGQSMHCCTCVTCRSPANPGGGLCITVRTLFSSNTLSISYLIT